MQTETAAPPVTLPDVSILVYREIVRDMAAIFPAEASRIGRALAVLLQTDLRSTAETGRYLVQSCQDAATYYEATSWSCTCPDRQRHEGLRCKHSFAIELLNTASAIASYEHFQARYTLTCKGERALATTR
jgi:hypothetical protein